jgi:hypothetical protein
LPHAQATPGDDWRPWFVVVLQHEYIRRTVLPVVALGVLLPVMRELFTFNDLEFLDFAYLLSLKCTVFYAFTHQACSAISAWPAYFYLSLFFLVSLPLVLINHQYAHFAAFSARNTRTSHRLAQSQQTI